LEDLTLFGYSSGRGVSHGLVCWFVLCLIFIDLLAEELLARIGL